MKTKIFLYGQEFSENWPNQNSTKNRISYLTNKYIYALNQIDFEAEVIITFDVEDGSIAEEKDMDFLVIAKNKNEENFIWDIIIKIKNKIDL